MKFRFVLFLLFSIILLSCNNDENETHDLIIPSITTPVIGADSGPIIGEVNATPCDFSLIGLTPNTKKIIDCTIDLKGETVRIPTGVKLIFNYGQIINGTLKFESNGSIDGDLLNISLDIEGDVKLSNPDFNFNLDRWGITQGKVSNDIALTNRLNLQKAINITSKLEVDKFLLGEMEVYFKITPKDETQNFNNMNEHTILIPSNFHLSLSEETVLKVQPNAFPWSTLITVHIAKNVKISGGTLLGDRYEHNYVPFFDLHNLKRSTHEWSQLILVSGSENVTIDNITLKSSTADGFIAGSAGHRIHPETVWNKNIKLVNSVIADNRRNNVSITDGEDILIENNQILDAGIGTNTQDSEGTPIYSSAGVPPRFGLDVEPFVGYADFTFESIRKFEWVENVIIRGNTFKRNSAGSIIVYSGSNVLIDNNYSDHVIAQNATFGSKIINNTLEARDDARGRVAIATSDYRKYIDFKGPGGTKKQYAVGNDVKNNTIRNFFGGYTIRGNDAEVSGNILKDVTISLIIDKAENISVHDNVSTSNVIASKAIRLKDFGNNIDIYNEKYTLSNGFYIDCRDFNLPNDEFNDGVENFTVTIRDSEFNSYRGPTIRNSNGVEILNNKIFSTTKLADVKNVKFNNNIADVSTLTYHGITLESTAYSEIKNNTFTVKTSVYQGIFQPDPSSNIDNTIIGNKIIEHQ